MKINKKIELECIANEMYNLNAQISAFFIAQNKGLSKKDTITLNQRIEKWIKRLRSLNE